MRLKKKKKHLYIHLSLRLLICTYIVFIYVYLFLTVSNGCVPLQFTGAECSFALVEAQAAARGCVGRGGHR